MGLFCWLALLGGFEAQGFHIGWHFPTLALRCLGRLVIMVVLQGSVSFYHFGGIALSFGIFSFRLELLYSVESPPSDPPCLFYEVR